MNGPNETLEEDDEEVGQRAAYERSSLGFPYFDLGEGVRIAKAMSEHVGGGDASDDQLGPWIGLSPKSSGYRSRISAARMFGLLEAGKEKDHRLSELGLKVIDETHKRAGKSDAFLNVPLFKRVFEQWRGQQLPPAAALERAMVGMGVAEKLTARARQVMERSAAEAGYFEQGRDRLVSPGIKETTDKTGSKEPTGGSGGGGGAGSGGGGPIDPIVQGLLARLPPPGATWPETDRAVWLDLLKGSFKLIYKDGANDKSK